MKFLQNPQVINSSLATKQTFLQKKGLTDQEIQIACERAGSYILHDNQNRISPPPSLQHVPIPYSYNNQIAQLSFFDKVKEVVHNMALFSAVVYAVYMFYNVTMILLIL